MSKNIKIRFQDFSVSVETITGLKKSIISKLNAEILLPEWHGITGIYSFSGVGKSTLLKSLCGIQQGMSGTIVYEPAGESLKTAFIPGQPSTLPWLSTRENAELACKIAGTKNTSSDFDDIFSICGIAGYEDFSPYVKSMGFRFRISLAMAVLSGANILCVDGALNGMKAELKNECFDILKDLFTQKGIRTIYTTSDISELLYTGSVFILKGNPVRTIVDCGIEKNTVPDLNKIISQAIE